jgi:hypothetical protein
MKLWKNPQPTYTEWTRTADDVTLSAPWVEASPEEVAWWESENQPVVHTPQEVGGGQIMAAMIEKGYAPNLDALYQLLDGILDQVVTDPVQNASAKALLRRASVFKRDFPLIEAVRVALRKTDEDINDLFRLADTK